MKYDEIIKKIKEDIQLDKRLETIIETKDAFDEFQLGFIQQEEYADDCNWGNYLDEVVYYEGDFDLQLQVKEPDAVRTDVNYSHNKEHGLLYLYTILNNEKLTYNQIRWYVTDINYNFKEINWEKNSSFINYVNNFVRDRRKTNEVTQKLNEAKFSIDEERKIKNCLLEVKTLLLDRQNPEINFIRCIKKEDDTDKFCNITSFEKKELLIKLLSTEEKINALELKEVLVPIKEMLNIKAKNSNWQAIQIINNLYENVLIPFRINTTPQELIKWIDILLNKKSLEKIDYNNIYRLTNEVYSKFFKNKNFLYIHYENICYIKVYRRYGLLSFANLLTTNNLEE